MKYVTERIDSLEAIENIALHCNLGSLSERLSLQLFATLRHGFDQTIIDFTPAKVLYRGVTGVSIGVKYPITLTSRGVIPYTYEICN